ncbi:leucine-rich repeat and immunoglobulin-like domain-containing nogo receptor-interacting protein 4 [Sceloporus undulatus]|uniref:leucine-rich repeat and immunoglobulin-like domain-containing nogo receptor-interacting protein 4 n=1 Tax=Sceloporus undulatus TaxID=8520 RepID=UPI001C4A974C|nr:leucine-rich repeat and immunoglobulin-like domain-containing nogo receptor-interacting protein 4 [Sceloporus undulatus]
MAAKPLPDCPSSWILWQALLFLISTALFVGFGQSCPSKCFCPAQDKSIFCNSRNLTTVPGRIPPDSEFLDLSRNSLHTLREGMFSRLWALKELDLSHNMISNIEDRAFNCLQNLMTLRLKGNRLNMVPDGIFTGLPNLSVLDISENRILVFLDHSFRDLSNLRKLETGDNHLVFISSQAFSGLQSLQQLTLEKCNITSVPTQALSHLRHLVELRLKVLNISVIPNYAFQTLHRLKDLEIHRWPFLTALQSQSLSGLNITSLAITRCNLHDVPYKAIKHLAHLRFLDLSYNPISVIRGRRLADLSRLHEFHLTGGQLATIQTHAFQGLVHFRLLNVSSNDLQTLEEKVFHSVGNLEVLRLDQNPLVCDCRLLWIVRRRRRLNFESQPVCSTNSTGKGKTFHKFSQVPPGHFRCRKPTIEDKALQRVNVDEGGQANLTCKSDGDPPPTVSWVSPQNITLDTRHKGRMVVLPDGTLKILYALAEDSGSYHCLANNAAGIDTMVAYLNVSILLFNSSLLVSNASLLRDTGNRHPFLVDLGTLVGILVIGVVPFLCSVMVCFIFISLWSKGRGSAKHHVIESVPRFPRGYKAMTSKNRTPTKKPR